MGKKLLLVITFLFMTVLSYAQERQKTKIDSSMSKTEGRTKFIDYKLSNLQTSLDVAETRIRKITDGKIVKYFYQISKDGNIASIEYSDLLKILKELKVLKDEHSIDIMDCSIDYMENKFTTKDGFQVGYYVSKRKYNWYIKFNNAVSTSAIFINNVDTIEKAFVDAKNKIDELMKNK